MTSGPEIQLHVAASAESGAWNMACDECLLENAIETGRSFVRIYRWDEATVSLGYFQPADDADADPRLAGLPRVRRLSGGGAILHHHEITYSFALPPDQVPAGDATGLYVTAHTAIVRVLRQHGVSAAMRGSDRKLASEPFLCFVRGDRHDILCGGHKIVGSAQRRRRGAVLQHGSIILRTSPHTAEIPGIEELAPGASLPDAGELANEIGDAIAQALGTVERLTDWPTELRSRMRRLAAERYSRLDWGRGRSGQE